MREHRSSPRKLSVPLQALESSLAPDSPLGRIQSVWLAAAGDWIGARATPIAEYEGVLSVLCESSAWAQELDLMSGELIASLNRALGEDLVVGLRCRSG